MNNRVPLLETSFHTPTVSLKTSRSIKFKTVLQELDKPGQNNRVYPTAVITSQLEQNKQRMKERRFYGELDHPDGDDQERISKVSLKEQSHIILDYSVQDGVVYGELETLPTPNGLIVKALIENNNVLGVSLRALGTLKESYSYSVVDDLQLITYDIVSDPSFKSATFSKKALIESIDYALQNDYLLEDEIFNVSFITTLTENFRKLNLLDDKHILQFIKYLDNKIIRKK